MSALLSIERLEASYGRTRVLHGIDLQVRRDGISALLGANGAGKTSTIRAICGVIPVRGRIVLDGENIAGRAIENVARLGVAHVPENRGTFVHLSVHDNLRVGAHIRKDRAVEADIERFYTYFPRLKQRWRQQAGTLSGGEQQMLALSRALMQRPRVLLLDEPSFGLAPLVVAEIFEILRQVNRESGVGMLLVEQNANMALQLADYGYVLEAGQIALHGDAADLMRDDAIRRSYLGH
ncbi:MULTISPECIES: ABC transporter ATP-binding protein [unclassified Chelatococcus]|uniref:ABC transporter ATP-binding protein n=1 Tax=unclassified Chelatococcus TaxID=2638111 RepID=UPI001BCFB9DD|nr:MULTISPECIES: ABC transporter ATP-binding protein [unclassified Chelatococcus]CAH1654931.1 branched chain amino acid/phenylalanine ABC transporter ATP binding subunit LivF [Hyphomicrobiales bacterium]MBS7742719.1 ABC transporter ATP-binding protein [Chelatococcus sp. HY11]MBX3542163.1 ABC transporter ATP-binding protein [Chelatococcus sp.]MCO5075622.1 ABC transporter ATP-binding protein [Chelatococcus sp.]CAH1695159.1 branched chain amino acid/phenylalanine ABC transporter ATP binding subun